MTLQAPTKETKRSAHNVAIVRENPSRQMRPIPKRFPNGGWQNTGARRRQ
jgi:hypothetical protein